MKRDLKNTDVLSVVFPLFFPGKVCFQCKVYGKEGLSTVENDQIQDQIRELGVYEFMESAEEANCPF